MSSYLALLAVPHGAGRKTSTEKNDAVFDAEKELAGPENEDVGGTRRMGKDLPWSPEPGPEEGSSRCSRTSSATEKGLCFFIRCTERHRVI
jgi:hypothetical protein